MELYADDDGFLLVAHSFGSLLALKIAKTLEMGGRVGNIVIIDGSPLFIKLFSESLGPVDAPDDLIQNEILKSIIRRDFPNDFQELTKQTMMGDDWDARLDNCLRLYSSHTELMLKYSRRIIKGLSNRLKMSRGFDETSFPFLNATQIALFVPTEKLFVDDIVEDYGLGRFSSHSIKTLTVNGNHLSILMSEECFNFINSLL